MSSWPAYAKINLSLEVSGRRRDGYHNVLTILQTIDLHDTLTFEPADDLSLTCSVPQLAGKDNLVMRAARLLQKTSGHTAGAAIHLEKGIPVAAGLGGGSSDAATTLVALSQLWGLHMSDSNLQNLAAALGSDVPFFLVGGTVLATERGQALAPLPALPEHWVVLVRPDLEIPDKTALMYACLTPREYTDGTITRHVARMIQQEQDLEPGLIFNVFEWVAFQRFERIDDARQQIVEAGADHVRLCGAGPSLYAIYRQEALAGELCERLQAAGLESYLACTISARPAEIVSPPPAAPAPPAAARTKRRRPARKNT